ncbi:hypothetical protein [endosymbiont GvMRE of Glomus versiforme]|uniref:hypothetical protein n=1 Tax=endosymbiont GvMRE of Glomus versiforme TaxID=2039283 RepID=UPI000EC156CB|nr:hypothetical protein [endosymbiont GvMRE of Glomus versiforme]RHZ35875.1 hypothetical protein GvMRE_Ic4g128 [endosymbiont GvMRE of Glomus versiforme]
MGMSLGILGALCGVCLAPFTAGASLGLTCACAGAGFVAGSVLDRAIENSNGQQASPEAYNLLGKSIEELNKLREDLRKEQEENVKKAKETQEQLESVRAKINNPELRQSHETEESLKRQEMLLVNELSNLNRRGDSITTRLTKLEQAQTNAATTGANVAGGSISSANLGNMANSFKPSFTTKLIIAGAVILLIYFLVVKK